MIFREYDIRGIYGKDLTEEVAEGIGMAYGYYLKKKVDGEDLFVSVARDVRLSSNALKDAIARGITSSGVNVVDLGICPTPLLYFSLYYLAKDVHPLLSMFRKYEVPIISGGIMVTGSHNPPEYNGFKVSVGKETIYGDAIQELRIIYEGIKNGDKQVGRKIGKISQFNITKPYLAFMKEQFKNDLKGKPVKVVVDAGNGAAGPVAVELIKSMGCEVVELYCEPDGNFPNHHPDPTVPKNLTDLESKVKESGADIGIAYDGDGDRVGVVDNTGEIIWADRLMILFSRDILKRYNAASGGRGDKASIVFDVKCSHLLAENIERYGGRPIMWKTGHSLLKSKLKKEKSILAGEMSGHIFFADRFFGYDDAVYASLRTLDIVIREGVSIKGLLSDLPKTYSTPEIRKECPEERKFEIVDDVVDYFKNLDISELPVGLTIKSLLTIDGVRVLFNKGWALLRASNTQPVLVLRFEAETEQDLNAIMGFIYDVLNRIIE